MRFPPFTFFQTADIEGKNPVGRRWMQPFSFSGKEELKGWSPFDGAIHPFSVEGWENAGIQPVRPTCP